METNTNEKNVSKEFEKFESLTRQLVSVPKKEIQEREAKEKASKLEQKRKRPND